MREEITKSLEEAEKSGRYLITITHLDKKGELQYRVHLEKFPTEDMIAAGNRVRNMVKALYSREIDSGKDQL